MGVEVKLQGEKLNKIVEDIEAVKENVENADSEIREAERRTKIMHRKIIFILFVILLVIALLITLIIYCV